MAHNALLLCASIARLAAYAAPDGTARRRRRISLADCKYCVHVCDSAITTDSNDNCTNVYSAAIDAAAVCLFHNGSVCVGEIPCALYSIDSFRK